MNGRVGSLFVILVLLVGFGAGLAGAGNESVLVEDEEVEMLVVDVVDTFFEEEDVVVENVSIEIKDEENVSIDVLENESFFELNDSVGDLLNASEEVNESVGAGGFVEVEYEYVDIDELVGDVESVDVEVEPEVVLKELVKDGMVELEFEIVEGDDVEITKKEVGRGDNLKDVLISSDEHFDDEVVVYSNLPSPALKEDIVVVWENEDEVVLNVEYFDLDEDGLVDRISWVVPHLSSQHYSIEIVVGDGGSSDELTISVSSPVDGEIVSNPVVFDFSIDYINSSDVECNLAIDGDIELLIEDGDVLEKVFDEGSYSWSLECVDKNDILVSDIVSGSFIVEDLFELELDDFFLKNDGVAGRVKANDGVVELTLIRVGFDDVFLMNLTDMENGVFRDFNIGAPQFGEAGEYSIKAVSYFYSEPASIVESFDLSTIGLSFESNVDEGDDVEFVVDVASGLILTYDLYVGNSKVAGGYDSQTIVSDFEEGIYEVWLRNINGGDFGDVDFGDLNVANGVDTTDPDVDLNFPGWEDVVSESDIVFEYEVYEEDGIANCSFKLYTAREDSSGIYQTDDLIFPISSSDDDLAFEDDIEDGEEIEIRLIDFDEDEDYIWEVRCVDDAGNEGWDFNYFSVELNDSVVVDVDEANYSRKAEVEKLIEDINSFLEKEKDLGLEERKILEILGLDEDMSFWKKRMVQMDQDLKFNLKFMEETKRVKRIAEIYDEIDEIEGKVVLNVESVDSYEFSKSSLDLDLGEVIGDYLDASGTNIGNGALKSLVRYNEELQGDLGVSVEAWRLELEYLDGMREIVLVSKNIDVTSGDGVADGGLRTADGLIVLEVLDSDHDVVFVSDVEDVGNGIYSVDTSKLEGGNLVYYFEEGFALKEVEKMESVLFGEGASGGSMFTGMFIGAGDSISGGSFFWLPMFLFVGYFGFLIFGKVRLESWKKEPGVEELVRLINETSRLLREGRVDLARDKYRRMGEIYKALPMKCRDFFYGEIKRVRLAIDKKDVLGLIREYEAAKDSFRKDDAVVLHGKINAIYRKLPRKFQEKVYQRLIKREV